MVLEFNPNKKEQGKWATFIPSRSPQFKIHRLRAHGMNALSVNFRSGQGREGILYENVKGTWVEIFRHEIDKTCKYCGEEVTGHWYRQNAGIEYGKPVLERRRYHLTCQYKEDPENMSQWNKEEAEKILNQPTQI